MNDEEVEFGINAARRMMAQAQDQALAAYWDKAARKEKLDLSIRLLRTAISGLEASSFTDGPYVEEKKIDPREPHAMCYSCAEAKKYHPGPWRTDDEAIDAPCEWCGKDTVGYVRHRDLKTMPPVKVEKKIVDERDTLLGVKFEDLKEMHVTQAPVKLEQWEVDVFDLDAHNEFKFPEGWEPTNLLEVHNDGTQVWGARRRKS